MGTSIVVATRDRPQRLRACLDLLRDQGADELLVVDDGSRDEAAVAAAARTAGARLVRQPPSGVATARNTGVAHARGDLLLFTDDDCVPSSDWATALAQRLRSGADVVAGPVLAARPGRSLDVAWQLISDRLVEDHSYLLGGNFGARAEALAAVPFDTSFDGVGAEDRDWWARVREHGLRVEFVADAPVGHEPDLGLVTFARKQLRYGRGAYRFRARHTGGRAGSPAFYGALVRQAARQGPAVATLVLMAQAAAAAGFAAEAVRDRPRRDRGTRAPRTPAR